jgi:tetrahydromethanopterin S-methyltransferase subunit G
MIGNILIDNKLKVDDNFNVVDSFDELIEGIPTLIIGLDNANKLNKKLNYVDRKIDNNTFWTFSKSEKRMLFEDDIFYFIENSYKSLINVIFKRKDK